MTTHNNGWLGGENQARGSADRQTRWLTPYSIVEPLGAFDLDPAGAPGHTLAARTYQLDDGEDGLTLPWFGRVWLNPPYGRYAEPFLRRLVEHGTGTALLFARTETASFQKYVWDAATAVLFLRGRLTFLHASGVPADHNAGAPSVLVAYGDQDAHRLRCSGIPGRYLDLFNRRSAA